MCSEVGLGFSGLGDCGFRIVCFDVKSGDKRFVVSDPSMKTVYAIVYDPVNLVIHAATGENKGEDAVGLTFDVSPIGFGSLLQKWSHKTEVSPVGFESVHGAASVMGVIWLVTGLGWCS